MRAVVASGTNSESEYLMRMVHIVVRHPRRGSPILVEAGDFLAMPYPDAGEIYRIKKSVFVKTYIEFSDELGGDG